MRSKLKLQVILLSAFLLVSASGCGDSGQNATDNQPSSIVSEKEEGSNMENKEMIEYIAQEYSIDFSDVVKSVKAEKRTTTDNYYVELEVSKEKQKKVTELIENKFGNGVNPDKVIIPKANNEICNRMNQKGVKAVYILDTAGDDGAKTKTLRIFVAEEGDSLFLYFM